MAAFPEPLIVKKNVSSICSSAKVGQYFGFYNREGALPLAVPDTECCPHAPALASLKAQPYSTQWAESRFRVRYHGCGNAGGSIEQLTVTCKGAYSRLLGLLRLGRRTGRGARGQDRMDFVGIATI